ncbi:hypothetical protein MPH_07326 [Macrophomina phaseolina MS6]|uniref:Aflatoxin regulatory protein domain-containing protein n=2 Tax=Macrophomina phaseolina TaxID=35725 RepID=K2SF44_MACPH|nr:hypothetical protein MPH_07326 [Macrophomina phaseolina MS6]
MQLPTPVDTWIGSSKGSPSDSAGAEGVSTEGDPSLDLSVYDYDFSPSGFDLYGLDSCLSPLASASFPNAWFDPMSSQVADSAEPSSKVPTPSPSKCECVQRAVTTLEEAAPGTELGSFSLAQSALAAHKQSLTQCETLLACTRCSSPSSVMMLVLMVLDKLITSFRQIHAFSQSWTGLSTPDDAGGILRQAAQLANTTGEVRDRRISLGDYQIDSSSEWSRVMDVLLLFQLSRLNRLLMKLRARVNSSKEESQLQIIQQVEDRLRTFLTNFERSTSFSIC